MKNPLSRDMLPFRGRERSDCQLNTTAVAAAFGILWSFGILFLTLWVRLFSRSQKAPMGLGRVYPGYRSTLLGSLIGAAWGLLDALLFGWLYAWLYNTVCRFLGGRRVTDLVKSN